MPTTQKRVREPRVELGLTMVAAMVAVLHLAGGIDSNQDKPVSQR